MPKRIKSFVKVKGNEEGGSSEIEMVSGELGKAEELVDCGKSRTEASLRGGEEVEGLYIEHESPDQDLVQQLCENR